MCADRSMLLHVRCGGCAKMYRREVSVPTGFDVPTDGDELVQSAFVRELKFCCPRCEAVYAEIVAFKLKGERHAA